MWWEGGGGCDVIFNITEGRRTNFFCFAGGVLSKFLLDNSSFSAPPPPLLIIIAQFLNQKYGLASFKLPLIPQSNLSHLQAEYHLILVEKK